MTMDVPMSNQDELKEKLEQLLYNKMLFEKELQRMHEKQIYSPGVMKDCKNSIAALNKEIEETKKNLKEVAEDGLQAGKDIVILCFGPLLETCKAVAIELNASLIDMRFIKPIDETIIVKNALSHKLLVTVEDNTLKGGGGSAVLEVLSAKQISCKTLCLGIPDKFLEHGSQDEVYKICGLDKDGILSKIVNHINR